MSDVTREQSLAALRWLAEAGADEAILEAPLDRFATPATRPEPARPPASRPTMRPPQSSNIPPPITASAQAVSLSTAPGAARALAASCNSLVELKTAISNFDGCELKRSATNTVFADGNPESRIMFIGEAPGADEDIKGLPFVGRAGQLLDRMLAAIELDRTKVYITNVLPWRPPKNREPSPEEAAICLPFLQRHIALVDPAFIVLLGGTALRHVMGTGEGIMRSRGRWDVYQAPQLTSGSVKPIPVLPTLHPAYLLRQPASKRLAWRDFLSISGRISELGLLHGTPRNLS